MKKTLAILLILLMTLCLAPAAPAEDCFTLDVDTLDMDSLNNDEYVARNLSAQTQGVRVVKYLSDSSELAAPVRLTLTRMDTGALIFDKDYGFQSGTFDSDVIYLPYVDSHTVPYLVTLYVGDTVYAMPFMHLRARLSYNGGCTRGVRLGDLDPSFGSDWLMGTMVDLDALRQSGGTEVDVCASGSYIVGRAGVSVSGDTLSVTLGFYPDAQVEVHHIALYVITDCAGMTTADVSRMGEPAYAVGDAVNVAGASSALIYLPMQLSFDPAQSLATYGYDAGAGDVQYQRSLWAQNRSGSATYADAGAQGEASAADDRQGGEAWADDGWDDDGWADEPQDGYGDYYEDDYDGWVTDDGSFEGDSFVIAP